MFKPKTNSNKGNTTNRVTSSVKVDLPTWHESCGDLNIFEDKFSISVNKNAVLCSDVDNKGSRYAVGHSDGQIYMMNLKKGSASSFLGFNGQVCNVQFGCEAEHSLLLGMSPKSKSVKLFNTNYKRNGSIEVDFNLDSTPRFSKLI